MNGRMKFQVWSESKQRWRTARCSVASLYANLTLMRMYGIKVRVGVSHD